MLNAAYAVGDGVQDRLWRVRMRGHIRATPLRLLGNDTDFLRTVLRNADRIAQADDAAGGHDLDRVSAGAEAFSHGHPQVVDTVHDFDPVVRAATKVQVGVTWVPVPTGLAKRRAGIEVPRRGQ